jgi:hypothetical protein
MDPVPVPCARVYGTEIVTTIVFDLNAAPEPQGIISMTRAGTALQHYLLQDPSHQQERGVREHCMAHPGLRQEREEAVVPAHPTHQQQERGVRGHCTAHPGLRQEREEAVVPAHPTHHQQERGGAVRLSRSKSALAV